MTKAAGKRTGFHSVFPYLCLSINGFLGAFSNGGQCALHPSDIHVPHCNVPAIKTAVVHNQDKLSRGGWG